VWPHLSGVRGDLSLVPLPARPGASGRAPSPGADDADLRLVLRGDVTHEVLLWSVAVGPDVLARVRVLCTADLTHLDDAGRALLVDVVRVAHRDRRRLHLPAPSAAATAVLGRLGLLTAVDRGPDPWAPSAGGRDGGADDRSAR
jgi:ABC-type transporter Mla MlaB component